MKRIYFIIPLLIACSAGKTQTWQDTVLKIEKIFSRYKATNPGAQLAISRNGNIIFSKAWGMADLEHKIPLTIESISEAGSVSKQFTAAAILLLEQQGKLSLDDDVRKYVPELPDYGHKITLRQMIQHKSGIKDWGAIAALSGWPRSTKTYTNEDALQIICNQRTLNFTPGDEFGYSNSNYQLLTIIVQRVSSMTLAEYTRKYIFEPAGMKHTQWRDDFKRIVQNRAMAYSKSGTDYWTNMPNEYVYGNGGLLTTAEDLSVWCNYFLNRKLGSPSLLEKQLSTSAFNNGVMHPYAAGLGVNKVRGWNYVAHSGATASYRANLETFPELGLSFIFLSNTSEFDNDTLNVSQQLVDLFIPVKVPEAKPEIPPTFIVSKEKLTGYEGWYRNSRTGDGLKLFIDNEKLAASQGGKLNPVAENVFITAAGNRVEINSTGLLVINTVKDSVWYKKTDPATPDEKAMEDYVGEYYSDEAEAKYHVELKNGKLVLILKGKSEFPLNATYKDGFASPMGPVYFERKQGEIINFKTSSPRARNVEFRKIK